MMYIKIENDGKNKDQSYEASLATPYSYLESGYGQDEIEALDDLDAEINDYIVTLLKVKDEITERLETKAREVDNFLSKYYSYNVKISAFHDNTDSPSKTFCIHGQDKKGRKITSFGKTITEAIEKAEKVITGDNDNEN